MAPVVNGVSLVSVGRSGPEVSKASPVFRVTQGQMAWMVPMANPVLTGSPAQMASA